MLEGMIVLITGASAGFGEVAAKKFVSEGSKVIGTGRRKERLYELKKRVGRKFLPAGI